MLKYLMKLRSRKAFTLVELVIAMAILAILMVCVAAFSAPVQDMVKATAADADSITANKIIGDYIENRLAFADKLTVFHAIDATNISDGNITSTWATFQARAAAATGKDKAGVLIFHYEEDPVEPIKSTYKIYDIIIPDSGDYSSTVVDGTTIYEEHAVFIDDFYVNSQNLIIAPTKLSSNLARGNTFAEFEIIPFDCDEDYPDDYITADTLKNYYDLKADHEADPALQPDESFGLDDLRHVRSGAIETVSFEVQNLKPKDIKTGWTALAPAGSGGTDIMVFYYIPHY